MDWQKASAELAKKLDPKNVQPAKQFGPKGDYIEGWFTMDEANRIFGHDGWSYTLMDCKPVMQAERKIGKAQKDGWGVTYIATVRVIVGGVTREDVGAGHGYDVDLGMAHESAVKESVTDAFKRAIRGFGYPFGLALYDKNREHVGINATNADIEKATGFLSAAETVEDMTVRWKKLPAHIRDSQPVLDAAKARKAKLTNNKEAA